VIGSGATRDWKQSNILSTFLKKLFASITITEDFKPISSYLFTTNRLIKQKQQQFSPTANMTGSHSSPPEITFIIPDARRPWSERLQPFTDQEGGSLVALQ
jgi:hypothetical protein